MLCRRPDQRRVFDAGLAVGIASRSRERSSGAGPSELKHVEFVLQRMEEIARLFIIGSSTFPTMSGHNPTLTIQALAYFTADAIVNRYVRNPGPLA